MTSAAGFRVASLTKIYEHWGDEPAEFFVQLHCEVKLIGDPGGEAFIVAVTSPAHLARQLRRDGGCEFGRGYLIILNYNEQEIISRLQALVDRSGGMTWQNLASSISRYFDWVE